MCDNTNVASFIECETRSTHFTLLLTLQCFSISMVMFPLSSGEDLAIKKVFLGSKLSKVK